MMWIFQLGVDTIRLKFIPLALKDLTKKWLYSLEVHSISTWDDFIKMLLKIFYPIHKTALIRNNIMQFKEDHNEPFWKYIEHFKDLLAQCRHHGIEKWRQYKIFYYSLNYLTKILLVSRRILKECREPGMGPIRRLSWKNNPKAIFFR